MLRRTVAFVFVETVLRVTFGKRVHFGIARGFGEDGGSGDFDDFTVALDDGFGGNAQIFRNAVASINTLSGTTAKPWTARAIASMVACRMLSSAISSGDAEATLHETACSLINTAKVSRFFSLSFFESVRPDRS